MLHWCAISDFQPGIGIRAVLLSHTRKQLLTRDTSILCFSAESLVMYAPYPIEHAHSMCEKGGTLRRPPHDLPGRVVHRRLHCVSEGTDLLNHPAFRHAARDGDNEYLITMSVAALAMCMEFLPQ